MRLSHCRWAFLALVQERNSKGYAFAHRLQHGFARGLCLDVALEQFLRIWGWRGNVVLVSFARLGTFPASPVSISLSSGRIPNELQLSWVSVVGGFAPLNDV
jgi:hypothetical protein